MESHEKILILGASGYMGSAFVRECHTRGLNYFCARRCLHDYETPMGMDRLLTKVKPDLVINCAAFIPTPSVDFCKDNLPETYVGNVRLPSMCAAWCLEKSIPIMHLSTGCLFDEEREYGEDDAPTRDLKGYCGVYLESKLDAESRVRHNPRHYILRLRLPFDEFDHPRNYLTKLAGFSKVFDHVNSLSHRGDFVKAALDLWNLRAPWGTYHVVNPGWMTVLEVMWKMKMSGIPIKPFELVQNKDSGTTGCKLSTQKLLSTGVKIRDVHEALYDAISQWKSKK